MPGLPKAEGDSGAWLIHPLPGRSMFLLHPPLRALFFPACFFVCFAFCHGILGLRPLCFPPLCSSPGGAGHQQPWGWPFAGLPRALLASSQPSSCPAPQALSEDSGSSSDGAQDSRPAITHHGPAPAAQPLVSEVQ